MKNSFYSDDEIKNFGFKSVGENVLISKKASFYGVENISLGDNVRIDDFCILSGIIVIGSYVHISAHTCLYGRRGIFVSDFSGLSPRVTIFSETDDFSGEYMIGPLVPKEFRNVIGGEVVIEKFVQVGANSIVFPNLTIGEGAAVGAMSLINSNVTPWTIVAGIPAKFIKNRKRDIIGLYTKFKGE